jgi:pimeloyl-ACP methyl ester carboxylesterase
MAKQANLSYQQSGTGFPVVLLHGFMENKEIWKEVAAKLSTHFQVIVPDMPGFGESQVNKNYQSVEAMADEIQKLLQSLQITQCIFIAHSLGGYVALAFAEKFGNILNGLGLFHSTAFADSEEKKQNREKTADFIEKNGVQPFALNFVQSLFYKGRATELAALIEQTYQMTLRTPKETAVAVTKAMRNRPDRTQVLKEATYPVLFIAGKADEAVPLEKSKEMLYLPNNAIIQLLDETAHMGMYERPEETYFMVEQFCKYCVEVMKK